MDLTDSMGSNLFLTSKGAEILRITPKPIKHINGNMLSDRCRYSQNRFIKLRLEEVYCYSSAAKKYSTTSWFAFLKVNYWSKINCDTINLLVSPELNIETLIYLKTLSNSYCNKIKLLSLKFLSFNKYVYIFDSLSVVEKKISNCILFLAHPKVEVIIFNFKLKIKYQKSLLSIFSFGVFCLPTIKTTFLNLCFNNLILFAEAKSRKNFSFFLQSSFPLIIFGSRFIELFSSFISMTLFLKNKLLTLKILKLNRFCNEESFFLLGINSNIKRKKIGSFFCIDLYETLCLYKNILQAQTNVLWFNMFKPVLCAGYAFNFLVPTFNFLEETGIFISLENRFQKTQKAFTSFTNSRAIKHIFTSLYFVESYFINIFLQKINFNLLINNYKLNFIFNKIYFFYLAQEKISFLAIKSTV